MASTIATVVIKSIHENYLFLKENYPDYGKRFVYFLATCLSLDPNIDLDIALKQRPYGGIVGIDNSSLDKYFKSFKILRLHAILHEAAGFVYEFSEKGPGYSYVLPFPVTNQYLGHVTDHEFCLYVKTLKGRLFSMLELLKSRAGVFDVEGFWNKSGFIVKELAVATENFIDIISILPPNSYRTLSSSDQKPYQWVSKFLHGLHLWKRENILTAICNKS